ncbi:hypothetical protein [Terracoccus luteus]|uniref:Uncharacterized protein n=1 Tax=Terracoccus luteus TaxID=53356 RepID=A0A839PR76_9MICO|nr:hypothetical protein [Terracoccus luteus]MBB2985997.1 hypothetical protein [Terracoccus luteus]MCP2171649.1 hypothetical protein [Terracoccus luteus]
MSSIVRATRRHQDRLAAALLTRLGGSRDRGDVPGWVLITLMTAGLVTVLWALAGEQLQRIFQEAISGVTGPGGS